MGAWTPASGRTPGIRRPVRTITRPSISLRRMAFGLPTSPLPSGVMVAALIPNPSSRSASAASMTPSLRVLRRSSRERSKLRFSISSPITPGSSKRSASRRSSSPVWSPCSTAMVCGDIDSNHMGSAAIRPLPDPPPLARGRGSRLGPDRLRDEAQLQHHAELVGHAPVLDDLPVFDPDEIDHVRECLDPGRGMAGEAAQVCAAASLPGPDLVARHHDLIDRDLEVGKRRAQVLDRVLRSLNPVPRAALVLMRALRYELVDNRQVALVETFFDQPPVDRLVRNRHASPLLLQFIRGILG